MPPNTRQEIQAALESYSGKPSDFEAIALRIFRYQAEFNPLYSRFLALLRKDPSSIQTIQEIPFLPVSFFKSHLIQTSTWKPEAVFTSSGTTGQTPSQHAIRDLDFYLQNTLRGFQEHYSTPSDWLILALLPSYLERSGSSLVAMTQYWIQLSQFPESGFFLHDLNALSKTLQTRPKGVPVLLLGVSFALLDFAEQFPMDLSGVTIMETGGMKGRRKEITRPELHALLQEAFQVPAIHSEYGMTELLSQGYAKGGTLFSPSATLRVLTTEINDPFCFTASGKTGVINLIDLANFDTCSFIATEDVGRVYENGQFEVLGRLDIAELRGCNLLIES